MEITMRYVRGHVEVYTAAGQFLFSADTEAEAAANEALNEPDSSDTASELADIEAEGAEGRGEDA